MLRANVYPADEMLPALWSTSEEATVLPPPTPTSRRYYVAGVQDDVAFRRDGLPVGHVPLAPAVGELFAGLSD